LLDSCLGTSGVVFFLYSVAAFLQLSGAVTTFQFPAVGQIF